MIDLQYLSNLAQNHADALASPVTPMTLLGQHFAPWPDVSLMGVVNLSPDSWYRESVCLNVEAAVCRGQRLAVEGARIIDVGAESTILQAVRVDAKAQTERLLPVIR